MVITSKNDMYVYFETICEIEPENVMDFGMFLERIGAVSRQVLDGEIDPDVKLTGVRGEAIPELPVYTRIYDDTYETDDIPEKTYDLAVMLHPEGVFGDQEIDLMLSWCKAHAGILLTDENDRYLKALKTSAVCSSIVLDRDRYQLWLFRKKG